MATDEPFPAKDFALGCLGLLGFLAVMAGLQLGAAWAFGLIGAEGVTPWHLAGGVVFALVMTGVVSIMGESFIEDVVKLVIGVVLASAAHGKFGDPGLAVGLGAPVGMATPFLARALSRLFPSKKEERAPGS
ncbi:MAG: hypothetical protein P1V51_23030 [Deltaproteobacteria bacterium]|nr:hypothetical protein [Deltaproteobacteria bacterium]